MQAQQLAGSEPTEYPFSASPYPSPRPSPIQRRSSLAAAVPASPAPIALFGVDAELARKHEVEQAGYADKRQALVESLDDTQGLVKGLAAFNQDKWTIHYPHQLGVATVDAPAPHRAASSPPQTPPRSAVKGARQTPLRRSASMFQEDAPAEQADEAAPARPVPQRAFSVTDAPPAVKEQVPAPPAHPLSILSLDLKMGHPSTAAAQLPALIPSLSLSTLSQLLSRRLTTSLGHLAQLRTRVLDSSSRVLVTGDLNAGKSTLVNALLRREVMPWDQQPCTTVFCEVVDAGANDGREELHAIRDVEKYDRADKATFDRFPLEEVYDVQDSGDTYQLVKAYVHDARAPAPADEGAPNPSLLKNGLVDISLIDAPGLNRDTLSTTALFARQSEIDVIVFVVSAENHFTLSAKEFLWNASREKAYVFIVVNKWGGIRDKARCMRVVGEQIKQLSPATWDNRAELVHFVDAAEYVDDERAPAARVELAAADEEPSAFDHLEQSLRSFVLLKRTKSKLAPAKHYLLNLLADLSTLASANVVAASDELRTALSALERIRPVHERLAAQRDEVEDGVDRVEEGVVSRVQGGAWARLDRALGFVAEGKVVPPASEEEEADAPPRAADSFAGPAALPPYPGVLGLWDWASEVKSCLVRALEAEVRGAEDDARRETVDGVRVVLNDLGDRYLPEEAAALKLLSQEEQQQHRATRTFRPEVMFAKRRRGVGRLAARGAAAGLGLGSAGVGVNWSATDFDVSFLDLFDLERMVGHGNALRGRAGGKEHTKLLEDDVVEKGTIVGLGLGSIGMVGSRIIGIKGTMGSLTRMIEMLGSKQARKWAGPVIGVLTVGLVVYVIVDLPRAIPRNIGRKLALSLSPPPSPSSSSASSQPVTFASAHADRIAREVRKVLRLAGWDLRERFRAALDKAASERREVEGVVARAEGALSFLREFEEKVESRQEAVKIVEL
ncbi:mitofusin [Rhodotorula kratochvilovae]